MSNRIFWGLIFISLLCAMSLHYYLYANGFYATGADESGRTLQAYKWMQHKTLKAQTWPPFHRVITGLALEIWPDLFLTPRVVSFIFGMFTLLSLSWLAYEIFTNKIIIVIASFLGAFFSPRVILSLVPLAEIMFIFMIISGSAFFARWLRVGKTSVLIGSAVMFALSTTARYEGWVFAGSLALALFLFSLFSRDAIRMWQLGCALLLLFVFPVFWIGLHFYQTGDALGFMQHTADRYRFFHGSSFITALNNSVLFQFVKQNFDSWNIVGAISLIYLALVDNRIKRWLFVPLIALLVMTALSAISRGLPTHNFWRIPAVWSILLIPFSAHWIYQQKDIFTKLKVGWRYGLVFSILLFITVNFLIHTVKMSNASGFSKEERAAGEFLRQQLLSNPKIQILIETPDWTFYNIIVSSQHPENFIYNSGSDPYHPKRYIVPFNEPIDVSVLTENNIRLLVFRAEPFKKYILQVPGAAKLADFGFWSIFDYQF